MAAGKFTVLDIALPKLVDGTIRLGVDDLRLVLCTATEALSASWTGASGQGLYSDLTAEVSGPGYAAGGEELSGVVISGSGSSITIEADPTVWESASFTVKYGVVCLGGTGADDVLGFFDVETTDPSGRTVTASDLTILWPSNLLTLTRTV